MTTRFVTAAVAAWLCAAAAAAQTPGELLEQGIFSQETAGDLRAALQIYERLATTPGVPGEIAARAQTRLAEVRRRQAAAHPATAPLTRSASAAAENARGPAALAARAGQIQDPGDRCCGMFSGNYDAARAVTIDGTVVRAEWANPETVVYVDGSDGNRWGFTTAAPNSMIRAGMNKDSFRVGDRVLVYAYLAKGTGDNCPGRLPNACATLTNGALHASASTITRSDGKVLFDRPTYPRLPQQ